MVSKIAQLVIRGLLTLLMGFGFFLNTDCENMRSIIPFLGSGVYGCCFIVSLGRMIEASLQINGSEDFVECFFDIVGIFLNVVLAGSIFHEFSQNYHGLKSVAPKGILNKGMISVMAGVLYLMDITSLYCYF